MLVELVRKDDNGPSLFTLYLWFLTWILLAALFGTTVETNGQWYGSITQICNGLDQCASISDVAVGRGVGAEVYFPCGDMKTRYAALLPLNITAFVLSFLLFCWQLLSLSDDDGRSWHSDYGLAHSIFAIITMCITGIEAVLVLYLHLYPICDQRDFAASIPGAGEESVRNESDATKVSMRNGLFDMELGPAFTLLAICVLLQLFAILQTQRKPMRDCCRSMCREEHNGSSLPLGGFEPHQNDINKYGS